MSLPPPLSPQKATVIHESTQPYSYNCLYLVGIGTPTTQMMIQSQMRVKR